ncbi:leucine-rich repeat and coiled-coil domain-containing protein 1-like [Tubulanus polymorphus]|uniref:leucine-rich repeat and coiled-coil domain-containing protein 1-like n=1 Tax=Tubulanus polymorphus TaxID=672921 RepID=UPI003DA68305
MNAIGDPNATELCLMDAGIHDLHSLPLPDKLQSLILHCNSIKTVDSLSHLSCLRHLDLSSNQIALLSGLENLASLTVLNLSCNNIKVIQGLECLRSLVSINLSYNAINDISGFVLMSGSQYALQKVELHGNDIKSQDDVLQAFLGCQNLLRLTLAQDGASNPVCLTKGYRDRVLSTIPQLIALDNIDRRGKLLSDNQDIEIPGFEDYIEYLQSSTTTSSNDPPMVPTPCIDAALKTFQRETRIETSSSTEKDISPVAKGVDQSFNMNQDQTDRIEKLELQLANLMKQKLNERSGNSYSSCPKSPHRLQAEKDYYSGSDSSVKSETPTQKGRKLSKDRREKKSSPSPSKRDKLVSADKRKDIRAGNRKPKREDEAKRDDLEATYQHLTRELSMEQERRWKAEQAGGKLIDHIKLLQNKVQQTAEIEKAADKVTNELKEQLNDQLQEKTQVEEENLSLKETVLQLQAKLEGQLQQNVDFQENIQKLESEIEKQINDRMTHRAHQSKATQEAQMRASALQREVDLVRNQLKETTKQQQQLQQLLATREQEHHNELSKRYSPESRELQELLQREVSRVEQSHQKESQLQENRIQALNKQYRDLEDEFRMALHMEADRYMKLESTYEAASNEANASRKLLNVAQEKDEKSNRIITELTALVKEQKVKITELSRSKQEQVSHLKERVQTLEVHLDEARRRMVQLEILKQEKNRFQSQVEAQESLIDGLRQEKKLWGQELAQQGTSLAQDRGRLEAKIEAQAAEIAFLNKQVERESSTVKIKTKMLEDQTDTIKKLKEGLLERDNEIKAIREDSLTNQKSLEQTLADEKIAYQEIQTQVDDLTERKEQLKDRIAELQEELHVAIDEKTIMQNKWKEKSTMISDLEEQVQQLKTSWENKEVRLQEERDKAVHAASLALEKMRSMDDAFRKQLDRKEAAHREEILRLVEEKQREIDAAETKVSDVEAEMRLLLKENKENKQQMENRVKLMSNALTELQQGLL